MARGVPTPEETELEFRKHYLVTGNASAAARAVGLPVDTGVHLAKKANKDPEFAAAREELRARVMPDAEMMLMSAMQLALERVNEPPPSPEKLAEIATRYGMKSIGYQDPRAAYFRGMSAALAAFTAVRKNADPNNGESPSEVTIRIVAAKPPESGDGGSEAA